MKFRLNCTRKTTRVISFHLSCLFLKSPLQIVASSPRWTRVVPPESSPESELARFLSFPELSIITFHSDRLSSPFSILSVTSSNPPSSQLTIRISTLIETYPTSSNLFQGLLLFTLSDLLAQIIHSPPGLPEYTKSLVKLDIDRSLKAGIFGMFYSGGLIASWIRWIDFKFPSSRLSESSRRLSSSLVLQCDGRVQL